MAAKRIGWVKQSGCYKKQAIQKNEGAGVVGFSELLPACTDTGDKVQGGI